VVSLPGTVFAWPVVSLPGTVFAWPVVSLPGTVFTWPVASLPSTVPAPRTTPTYLPTPLAPSRATRAAPPTLCTASNESSTYSLNHHDTESTTWDVADPHVHLGIVKEPRALCWAYRRRLPVRRNSRALLTSRAAVGEDITIVQAHGVAKRRP